MPKATSAQRGAPKKKWYKRRCLKQAGVKEYRGEQVRRQGGKCDLCGTDKPGSRKGWHTDHDHKIDFRVTADACPASLRGVLCHVCNVMVVAAFESDPARYAPIMPQVAAYVEKWKWECKLIQEFGEDLRPLAA